MSINDLIQSYPVLTFNMEEFVWYWLIIGTILVTIIGFLIYKLSDSKLSAFKFSFFSFIFMASLGISAGFYSYGKDVTTISRAQLKWREEVFAKQYLPSLEEVKVDVIRYSVNRDGSLNVLLNTTNKEKSIGGVGEISYYNTIDPMDQGYIKAKYVKAIEQVGINGGYYDVSVFIPKAYESTNRQNIK